jgi:hypothetical protein
MSRFLVRFKGSIALEYLHIIDFNLYRILSSTFNLIFIWNCFSGSFCDLLYSYFKKSDCLKDKFE